MPNNLQYAFLFSSFATFSVCYVLAKHLFPGIFPDFDLDLLLGRERKPPPILVEKTTMSFKDILTVNTAADLLKGDKLIAFLVAGMTAWILSSWFKPKQRKPVLDPSNYQEFPLREKIVISPNTALYRFALPHFEDRLGVPIGQHITVAADINGKTVARSYTPTSSDEDTGHFDLVVKTYEQGNISRYIGNLKVGDSIRVKGPKGQFRYTMGMVKEFGMIAGGTGITPMYQIITHILYNTEDRTRISLIYANQTKDDILLKTELDELQARNRDRFSVYYVLDRAPEGWSGGVGFVTKDMINNKLPTFSNDMKMLMCGPPPMITAMKKNLAELNFPPAQTISKINDTVFAF